MLSSGAITSHLAITLGAEVLDGLGEVGHVRAKVEQAGNIGPVPGSPLDSRCFAGNGALAPSSRDATFRVAPRRPRRSWEYRWGLRSSDDDRCPRLRAQIARRGRWSVL